LYIPRRWTRPDIGGNVQQDRVTIRQQEEIRDILALWRQHGRIDQPVIHAAQVVGDQALQEMAGVTAGETVKASCHMVCSGMRGTGVLHIMLSG